MCKVYLRSVELGCNRNPENKISIIIQTCDCTRHAILIDTIIYGEHVHISSLRLPQQFLNRNIFYKYCLLGRTETILLPGNTSLLLLFCTELLNIFINAYIDSEVCLRNCSAAHIY